MKKIFGFTLLEHMITAAVLAFVRSLATLSFRGLVLDNRLVGQTNQRVASLRLPRSEAVKRAQKMRVTPTDASDPGNECSPGWNVRVDENDDGVMDGTEVVWIVAVVDTSIDRTGRLSVFLIQPSGLVDNSDTFDIYNDRSAETARQVSLTATGRAGVTNRDMACT